MGPFGAETASDVQDSSLRGVVSDLGLRIVDGVAGDGGGANDGARGFLSDHLSEEVESVSCNVCKLISIYCRSVLRTFRRSELTTTSPSH